MDVYDAIKKRRSVRAYKGKEVDRAVLERMLGAMRLAPSANNSQNYKFVVVKDFQKRLALAQAAGQRFISQAPVVVVAVSLKPDYMMSCEVPAYPVDMAIALDHLTLAAVAEGLGTCWIGDFSQEKVKQVLNVPKKYKIVALMPLGVSAEKSDKRERKSLEELIYYDNFGN